MEAMTFRYECPNCHRVEFAGRMAEGSLYCPNADCAEIGWAMKCTVLLPPQSKTPRPFQTEVERRVADLERKVRDLDAAVVRPAPPEPGMSPEAYRCALAEEEGTPRPSPAGAERVEITDVGQMTIRCGVAGQVVGASGEPVHVMSAGEVAARAWSYYPVSKWEDLQPAVRSAWEASASAVLARFAPRAIPPGTKEGAICSSLVETDLLALVVAKDKQLVELGKARDEAVLERDALRAKAKRLKPSLLWVLHTLEDA